MLFSVSSPSLFAQQKYQQDDIDRGYTLYNANCALCHADGAGIAGVDLRTGQFRHAANDEELMLVIRNGIAGTAMPAHPALTSQDIVSIVAYVRTMRDYGATAVKLGDAKKGKAHNEGEGHSADCHRVNGKGSRVALDLSDVGAIRPATYLQRALLDPQAVANDAPQNRFMQAVAKNGTVFTGRRLNEDTFTVQLLDDHQNLVSFEKSELRSLKTLPEVTMPSAKGKFSDAQISDLVAYLVSLNPAAQPPPAAGAPAGGHE